jgi:hypothetical protein
MFVGIALLSRTRRTDGATSTRVRVASHVNLGDSADSVATMKPYNADVLTKRAKPARMCCRTINRRYAIDVDGTDAAF